MERIKIFRPIGLIPLQESVRRSCTLSACSELFSSALAIPLSSVNSFGPFRVELPHKQQKPKWPLLATDAAVAVADVVNVI